MKQMLAQIKALNPTSSDFKAQIKQLQTVVQDHVDKKKTICSLKFAAT
jgi:hypothetical protein